MPSPRYSSFAARARALACPIVFVLASVSQDAFALAFTVNTLADTSSGNTSSGSLRDALNAVNGTTNIANTITFQAGLAGQITLTAPLPLVLNNVIIDGAGATIVIDGASTFRIFFVGVDAATALSLQSEFPNSPLAHAKVGGGVTPLAVTLKNLSLQHGYARGGLGGGAGGMGAGGALFVNSSAVVTVEGVSLDFNQAVGGSGGSAPAAGAGGLGGAGSNSYSACGGGGIFGKGGTSGGGGVFGDGGDGGGGGFTGIGGGIGGNGTAGTVSLAGMSGPGGNSFNGQTGGATGGGGGGGTAQGSGGGGFMGANGTSTQGGNGGFGGGGGANAVGSGLDGGNGGFGGGGGGDCETCSGCSFGTGGNGGFGGGAGGIHGAGGFGGGGGLSGNGGFGGGGGALFDTVAMGGFGGGIGGTTFAKGGGGGAGFGGAVFLVYGATLTIQGNLFISGGGVIAGAAGGNGSGAGSAAGSGVFLQGSGTQVFAPATGVTQTIADAIADEVGSGIPSPPSTSDTWALSKSGAGTLVLSGVNAYAGDTTVSAGILRITGDITSSALSSVAVGATLTGTGKVRDVVVYGTIVPGTSTDATGVLQTFHTLDLAGSALSCFHADGAGNSSRLLVTPAGGNPIGDGFVFLGGVARIDFSAPPGPGEYLLVSAGILGSFSGFETNVPGLAGQLNYFPSQVTFSVLANDTLFRGGFEAPSASQSACAAAFAN